MVDYGKLAKDELIKTIEELITLNKQLLDEKELGVGESFSWIGNLGYWYWNIQTNSVTFNSLKITNLGYSKDEIPDKVNYQFFTDKLHPEDYELVMNAMRLHLQGKSSVYEVEYRIKAKDGSYKWYYDKGRITQYDSKGKPLLLSGMVFDITNEKETRRALEEKNKLLSKQAITDGLTKLNNYRALNERLEKEINHSKQNNTPLSIALFDIDNFKKINDTKGHKYGDEILIKIGELLKNNVRDTDFVGRYGGEEFLTIYPNTSLKEAKLISEQIRYSIEEYFKNKEIGITVSGGVFEYKGNSLQNFINSADINLYEAKRQGKNRIL